MWHISIALHVLNSVGMSADKGQVYRRQLHESASMLRTLKDFAFDISGIYRSLSIPWCQALTWLAPGFLHNCSMRKTHGTWCSMNFSETCPCETEIERLWFLLFLHPSGHARSRHLSRVGMLGVDKSLFSNESILNKRLSVQRLANESRDPILRSQHGRYQ